ncbi:AMP-dependent synthetase/ligase [Bifidobacterium gallicum]|uniref:AMP-binding enzyme n=2 Tax=Bifidobacterium gallicum DSM 20093 = LMG 11596 TaxID=561180 RepID=D1NTR4_9BIFI|nr:AMP-binding protein [Bifidobacterium gallicum]EFA23118.1 AMP-binding enzyme [Bifidobacterium gallicum DSM 20093 = LMG 11596]
MLRQYGLEDMVSTTEQDTIYSLLAKRSAADPGDLIAQRLVSDTDRRWLDVTAGEMLAEVRSVAKGLMSLGVRQGSMVVLYAETSYDWGVIDFACAAIGAVSVPIYETDSETQAASIADEVKPVVAFGGDEAHTLVLERIAADREGFDYVFNFAHGALDAMINFGENIDDDALDEAIGRVRADDLLTIVYTSGSTGKPKGAMLSHRNFMHIVLNAYEVLPDMLYKPNRLLLFLPLAHCFARYIQYVCIGGHGVAGYVGNAKHLLADMRSFKPTYLLGVPRVFEKVYNAASQKAGVGVQGRVFANAFNHFVQWSTMMNNHEHPTRAQKMKHAFYMGTVGKSIRSALGPNLHYLACGGAPINPDLVHFFNGMDDLMFIQGYGMTETAAPMIVNWQEANRAGSVGRPGPGMAVSTADDGEILVKGPNVFLGYYKNPQLTDEVLEPSGWLHTGDLGTIDDEGFLYITGRKKDLIITAGGKNVTPAPMESTIRNCPIVSQAVVVGDNKPFIAALVTLDFETVRGWLADRGLDADMAKGDIANSDAVRAFVQQYVDKANSEVSRAESVRKFVILSDDFNQEDGTLTASMKVVRAKVLSKYASVIEGQLYAPVPSNLHVPMSVQILERTNETMRNAAESVSNAANSAKDRVQGMLKSNADGTDTANTADVTQDADTAQPMQDPVAQAAVDAASDVAVDVAEQEGSTRDSAGSSTLANHS